MQAGIKAKESILTAIYLNNHKINNFIVKYTTFLYIIIAELSRHFLLTIDYLSNNSTVTSENNIKKKNKIPINSSSKCTKNRSSISNKENNSSKNSGKNSIKNVNFSSINDTDNDNDNDNESSSIYSAYSTATQYISEKATDISHITTNITNITADISTNISAKIGNNISLPSFSSKKTHFSAPFSADLNNSSPPIYPSSSTGYSPLFNSAKHTNNNLNNINTNTINGSNNGNGNHTTTSTNTSNTANRSNTATKKISEEKQQSPVGTLRCRYMYRCIYV